MKCRPCRRSIASIETAGTAKTDPEDMKKARIILTGNEYDMTVNTAAFSARACAGQIVQHVSAARVNWAERQMIAKVPWYGDAQQSMSRH